MIGTILHNKYLNEFDNEIKMYSHMLHGYLILS